MLDTTMFFRREENYFKQLEEAQKNKSYKWLPGTLTYLKDGNYFQVEVLFGRKIKRNNIPISKQNVAYSLKNLWKIVWEENFLTQYAFFQDLDEIQYFYTVQVFPDVVSGTKQNSAVSKHIYKNYLKRLKQQLHSF